jgi:hypothetical protein
VNGSRDLDDIQERIANYPITYHGGLVMGAPGKHFRALFKSGLVAEMKILNPIVWLKHLSSFNF